LMREKTGFLNENPAQVRGLAVMPAKRIAAFGPTTRDGRSLANADAFDMIAIIVLIGHALALVPTTRLHINGFRRSVIAVVIIMVAIGERASKQQTADHASSRTACKGTVTAIFCLSRTGSG
jgi:hypothetical protein